MDPDRICNFNRHYAEYAGYWKSTKFLSEVPRDKPTVYYDSVTGKPLFVAPIGRSMDAFLAESNTHGWPSFRNEEVVWENVRILKSSGETVSADGTHLGHNLPDAKGDRCAQVPPRATPTSSRPLPRAWAGQLTVACLAHVQTASTSSRLPDGPPTTR